MSGKREKLEYIEIGRQIQDGMRKQGSSSASRRSAPQGSGPSVRRSAPQGSGSTVRRSAPQGSGPSVRRSAPQGSDPSVRRSTSQKNVRTGSRQAQYRKRQERRRRMALRLWSIAAILLLCLGISWCYPRLPKLPALLQELSQRIGDRGGTSGMAEGSYAVGGTDQSMAAGISAAAGSGAADINGRTAQQRIEEEMQELLEKNEETADFVEGYSDREKYRNQPIDLSRDYESGKVPLLMQWDSRWGYDDYGDSIIGLSGCGPTCLTMAYLYFTGDIQSNPRTMAEFAEENGYFVSGATSWALWTEGVKDLGLYGEELPLDENRIKNVLNSGGLVVCSMRPGDFTTTGHFILLTGYDENGFCVNDPNRRRTSAKQWDYDTLSWQIKNLWALTD